MTRGVPPSLQSLKVVPAMFVPLNYPATCQVMASIALSAGRLTTYVRDIQAQELARNACCPDDCTSPMQIIAWSNFNPPLASQAPSAPSACLACTLRTYHTESPPSKHDSALVGSSDGLIIPLTAVFVTSVNYGLSNISEKERFAVMPSTPWSEILGGVPS